MSKWTDFRDDVVKALDVEDITEEVKQHISKQIVEEVMPMVESVASGFVGKVQTQAATESGWCKIRDALILPAVINGGCWLVRKVLEKSLAAQAN